MGLDIGTEFVKALIARVDGETLEIVGAGRARQSVSDMHSGAIANIAAVVQTAKRKGLSYRRRRGLACKLSV